MSVITKKASLFSSSFFVIALLCSCSSDFDDKRQGSADGYPYDSCRQECAANVSCPPGCAPVGGMGPAALGGYNDNGYAPAPHYPAPHAGGPGGGYYAGQAPVPVHTGAYGTGGNYGNAGTSGDIWGPTCPLDGSDLGYLSTGHDVAITTPVPGYAYGNGKDPCAGAAYVDRRPSAPPHDYDMDRGMRNRAEPQGTYVMLECEGRVYSGGRGQVSAPCTTDPNARIPSYREGDYDRYDAPAPAKAPTSIKAPAGTQGEWVATEGAALRSLLQDWGDRAGWRVVWNSDREYIVEAGAVFKGEFMDVSSALIRAFARANPAPQATFYKGNRVLVINTQEAENAD